MEVIGHDDTFVEEAAGADDCRLHPFIKHDVTVGVENHVIVNDLPKQCFALIRAQRDEIRTSLPVVEIGQSNGVTVMSFRVVLYCSPPSNGV